jgi:rod shape-determining protein MreB
MGLVFGNKDIGIDLGTANTLIYIKGKGIVLNEASIIAVDNFKKKIVAVGHKAKAMRGKTPAHIEVVSPLEEGVIFDFEMTADMLKIFFKLAKEKVSPIARMRVVIGVPSGVTEVEKRAVEEIMREMGAKEVYILDEPMAAAIGSDIPTDGTTASLVADIGGGTSDIAVIALDGIVTYTSIRHAGNDLDETIVQYVRKVFKLHIGPQMAEDLKIAVGAAFLDEEDLMNPVTTEARGRDILTGLPRTVTISTKDMFDALEESVRVIVDAIKQTLERTPPEMAADIQQNGLVMTGGGSLLRGFDKLVTRETGLKVFIPENAKEAVAEGTGKALENIERLGMYESNKKLRHGIG